MLAIDFLQKGRKAVSGVVPTQSHVFVHILYMYLIYLYPKKSAKEQCRLRLNGFVPVNTFDCFSKFCPMN